jgi:hypothetical protein
VERWSRADRALGRCRGARPFLASGMEVPSSPRLAFCFGHPPATAQRREWWIGDETATGLCGLCARLAGCHAADDRGWGGRVGQCYSEEKGRHASTGSTYYDLRSHLRGSFAGAFSFRHQKIYYSLQPNPPPAGSPSPTAFTRRAFASTFLSFFLFFIMPTLDLFHGMSGEVDKVFGMYELI